MNLQEIPELAPLLREADHWDVKTAEGAVSLREYLAAMIAFKPRWMMFLYEVRGVFVRFLGMWQSRQPVSARYAPHKVPMQRGEKAIFFTVRDAQEGRLWVGEVRDRHLDAWLAVIAEPLGEGRNRFHVATIVHYNHWSGPVYFNTIRPFHHLVVGSMARAGARGI